MKEEKSIELCPLKIQFLLHINDAAKRHEAKPKGLGLTEYIRKINTFFLCDYYLTKKYVIPTKSLKKLQSKWF